MEKIKDIYPDLPKYEVKSQLDESNAPEEMIDLIKEYLPLTLTVGTVWGRSKPEIQRKQTEHLSDRCEELSKKILEFDFYGSIVINTNGIALIFRVYQDQEYKRKEFEWISTRIINFDWEWSQKE